MLKGKDMLSIHDLSVDDFEEILALAAELKAMQKAGVKHHILEGKTLGMIFENLQPAHVSPLKRACTSWAGRHSSYRTEIFS